MPCEHGLADTVERCRRDARYRRRQHRLERAADVRPARRMPSRSAGREMDIEERL